MSVVHVFGCEDGTQEVGQKEDEDEERVTHGCDVGEKWNGWMDTRNLLMDSPIETISAFTPVYL